MRQKHKTWLVAGVATLALTAALVMKDLPSIGGPSVVQAAEQAAASRTITVSGTGEMAITPDVAYINLGIRTDAKTAKEAQALNAAAYEALNKVIFEEYKFDKKDVQTAAFRVQPDYSYENGKSELKGYSAVQSLQVTYRDLDKLGVFLDAVSRAGANQIDGVRFSTEKGEDYELQVIEKAMDNAKAKASAIAKYAGKELKGIISVEQGGGVAVPMVQRNVAKMADMAMMESSPTSIEVGELKVSTSVTVQYEF